MSSKSGVSVERKMLLFATPRVIKSAVARCKTLTVGVLSPSLPVYDYFLWSSPVFDLSWNCLIFIRHQPTQFLWNSYGNSCFAHVKCFTSAFSFSYTERLFGNLVVFNTDVAFDNLGLAQCKYFSISEMNYFYLLSISDAKPSDLFQRY